ncbi:hypothetical protein FQA39_LY00349 [Lamprigera yunnana]|nr:hypothetical protein FQA39_LY00349 [Lamprigera yunnana]
MWPVDVPSEGQLSPPRSKNKLNDYKVMKQNNIRSKDKIVSLNEILDSVEDYYRLYSLRSIRSIGIVPPLEAEGAVSDEDSHVSGEEVDPIHLPRRILESEALVTYEEYEPVSVTVEEPIASVSEPFTSRRPTKRLRLVSTVILYGIPIVSLVIETQERLCLAQISNTLLKQYSYNEIHNRRVALGITCVQCTPVQLEILRRAGAMPVSSRRCGMITRREAERLCKSFLGDNSPPRLPDDFAFAVHHECAWGCRGSFLPSRYNSSRAKCIKCNVCGLFFSPNKFIFHSHRLSPNDKYVQPDAANFNSWRRHMKLSGNVPEDIMHAWEDVKAMFNGGTRKRLLSSSLVSRNPKQTKVDIEPQQSQPVVPAPRITGCQGISLPISRVSMDLIYNKPFPFPPYSTFPWLKRNPVLFPYENPFFPVDKSYQSAFKPVQPIQEKPPQKDDHSDDEVDIESTDEKMEVTTYWSPKRERVSRFKYFINI